MLNVKLSNFYDKFVNLFPKL